MFTEEEKRTLEIAHPMLLWKQEPDGFWAPYMEGDTLDISPETNDFLARLGLSYN